jgi:cytochrome P450
MLGALLAVRDPSGAPLAAGVLRDEVFTLLGAAYETTSTSIVWALEAILLERWYSGASGRGAPRSGERSIASEVTAGIARGDDAPLDAAIRESLRRRPTLPTIRRVAAAPFAAGGFLVPKGGSVVLAVHLLERALVAGGACPTHARPKALVPSHRDATRALFAFGGGTHACPGMALALDHMRGVLGALVPALELARADPAPSRPIFRGATLAPARAVLVRRVGK